MKWRCDHRSCTCNLKSTSFHVSFLSRVKMNSINCSALYIHVWVFIVHLVEHCSTNAKAMGLNPTEALKIF